MNKKFLNTVTLSNEQQKDILRVHIFTTCIKFDYNFALGVVSNKEISKEIFNIEKLWKERKVDKKMLVVMLIDILEKNDEYFKKFYFKPEQLDEDGKLTNIESAILLSKKKKLNSYYDYLKFGKKIKPIRSKDFENNLKTIESKNKYVDLYDEKAKFYSYDVPCPINEIKKCYLMTVDNNIKMISY